MNTFFGVLLLLLIINVLLLVLSVNGSKKSFLGSFFEKN